MTKISKAITPDDTEVVGKKIAEDYGILRHVEPFQILLFGASASAIAIAAQDAFNPLVWVGIAGAVGAVVATLLTPLTRNVRKQSKKRYEAFLEQYEFVTPAGEEVTFVSSNPTGTRINVRFSDGYEDTFCLYWMSNKSGERHEWARFEHNNYDHFKNLSKVKWRTPSGKTGVVRGVEYPKNRDLKLVLKLEDGQIATFELGTLEPVAAATALISKSEAVSS
jgi:hypothetical protein